jgi:hypothetical protein
LVRRIGILKFGSRVSVHFPNAAHDVAPFAIVFADVGAALYVCPYDAA